MAETYAQWNWTLTLSGRVQGVGFRPFVHRLAQAMGLKGTVCNDAAGVRIELQASAADLEVFMQRLQAEKPPRALLESLDYEPAEPKDFESFDILSQPSGNPSSAFTQITPDLAVCDTCLAEFHDPNNRRYHDPFINCSDCGPRYTLLQALPYERMHTSMAPFGLCARCEAEYCDPANHRFHTQGICCPECGPQVTLYEASGKSLAKGEQAIRTVAEALQRGELVAFKGVGGFHILADATDTRALQTLRQRKQRALKPFAVLCKDLQMASHLAFLRAHERELLCSAARPIVLVKPQADAFLSAQVAPQIERLGLFLAYTPLQHLLFEYVNRPLVATSANLSGEPILYQAEAVFDKLCHPSRPVVDYVLDYDREIANPCDDSIVQSIDGQTVTLRLGRGLAPYYLPACKNAGNAAEKSQQAGSANPVRLALGAQQKSAIALDSNGQRLLSPYIGELGTVAAMQRLQQVTDNLLRLQRCEINEVIADLHPRYDSHQWAVQLADKHAVKLVTLQHHYAHVLACMAEHRLNQEVLAFSWDGLGLGDDGTLWGSEVLLADRQGYERIGAVQPFKLLGGDVANRQPKRIALALLFEQFDLQTVLSLDSPCVQAFTCAEVEQLHRIYLHNLNCAATTSMGRVFDAVASLLGLVQVLDYEGQSGLLLERYFDETVEDAYGYDIIDRQIVMAPMIRQLMNDRQNGVAVSVCVSRFFNMLVKVMMDFAGRYVSRDMVVSGGVFQNRTLLTLLKRRFMGRRQRLYFQQQTPINDGGIALGQLISKKSDD
jgi:hydrogenase maturation protein HypF